MFFYFILNIRKLEKKLMNIKVILIMLLEWGKLIGKGKIKEEKEK